MVRYASALESTDYYTFAVPAVRDGWRYVNFDNGTTPSAIFVFPDIPSETFGVMQELQKLSLARQVDPEAPEAALVSIAAVPLRDTDGRSDMTAPLQIIAIALEAPLARLETRIAGMPEIQAQAELLASLTAPRDELNYRMAYFDVSEQFCGAVLDLRNQGGICNITRSRAIPACMVLPGERGVLISTPEADDADLSLLNGVSLMDAYHSEVARVGAISSEMDRLGEYITLLGKDEPTAFDEFRAAREVFAETLTDLHAFAQAERSCAGHRGAIQTNDITRLSQVVEMSAEEIIERIRIGGGLVDPVRPYDIRTDSEITALPPSLSLDISAAELQRLDALADGQLSARGVGN